MDSIGSCPDQASQCFSSHCFYHKINSQWSIAGRMLNNIWPIGCFPFLICISSFYSPYQCKPLEVQEWPVPAPQTTLTDIMAISSPTRCGQPSSAPQKRKPSIRPRNSTNLWAQNPTSPWAYPKISPQTPTNLWLCCKTRAQNITNLGLPWTRLPPSPL